MIFQVVLVLNSSFTRVSSEISCYYMHYFRVNTDLLKNIQLTYKMCPISLFTHNTDILMGLLPQRRV